MADTFSEALKTHIPLFAEQAAMQILPRIIDDASRGERFNNMIWSACEVRGKSTFLISDAPLYMTNGIGGPRDYLVMPISPTKLFVAVNDEAVIHAIDTLPADEIVRRVNEAVVCHASIFVGATDLSHRDYIEQHFNTIEHDTLVKQLARRYQAGDF